MNEYELMTILHPRLNADEVNATVETIQGQITGAGGEMLSTDVWGRRRLAYPIQHLLEGTYVLMTFRLAPTQTRTIESWLGISESVLRHLLIRGIIPYESSDRGEPQERRGAEPQAEAEEEEAEAESEADAEGEPETRPETRTEAQPAATAEEEPEVADTSDEDLDAEGEPAATGQTRTASE